MQIVIEIPDAPMKDYQDLFYKIHGMAASEGLFDDKKPSERAKALGVILNILTGITNGTVLPEHHGRLIDADALNFADIDNANYGSNYIRIAPTIIEADKVESE